MSSKFKIGDCVKLIYMIYPNLDDEGKEVIVIDVKLVQALYGSFYTYTVSIERDGGLTLDTINDLLESNLELIVKAEPMDIWPPPCSCDIRTAGCTCGAMRKEREMKEKGLVPKI